MHARCALLAPSIADCGVPSTTALLFRRKVLRKVAITRCGSKEQYDLRVVVCSPLAHGITIEAKQQRDKRGAIGVEERALAEQI